MSVPSFRDSPPRGIHNEPQFEEHEIFICTGTWYSEMRKKRSLTETPHPAHPIKLFAEFECMIANRRGRSITTS